MDDSQLHVIAPVYGAVRVMDMPVLVERDGTRLTAHMHGRDERVRLRDRRRTFQPPAAVLHGEHLSRAVLAHRFHPDGCSIRDETDWRAQPEDRKARLGG